MASTIVICTGNQARGDYAVGLRVAELLQTAALPHVQVIAAPQLDVVMAEQVADASLVVFVDAERRTSPAVEVQPLAPAKGPRSGHALDAAGLLALARFACGRAPTAVMVTVAAPKMGHATSLSKTATAAAGVAAVRVQRLLSQRG